MNNWKLTGTLLMASMAVQPLAAYSSDNFVVQAPVTHVEPLTRLVDVSTPQEVCWEEPVYKPTHTHRSNVPVVIGGVLGGVLGNAVGDGRRSRRAMTGVGAVLGAAIGYGHSKRTARQSSTYVTTQRICEVQQVTHQEERVDGYRVTYEYEGRYLTTRMAGYPGDTIPVTVRVQPVAYNAGYQPSRL